MGSSTSEQASRGLPLPPIDLVRKIVALSNERERWQQFSSLSGAIYDTAWVSMITKHERNQWKFLFPECFEYLLQSQDTNGTWGATKSQIDGILNSLAAFLALLTWRQYSILSREPKSADVESRIEKAYSAIEKLLLEWDVGQTVHVGFEMLVPALLRQLQSFDVHFNFPGYDQLMQLNSQKFRKFDSRLVYAPKTTTLLHSLEAFVGLIDFDKLGHHCTEETGIFGSPSSTAAYLINHTAWDVRAESYLKRVVSTSRGTGFIPSAYPTSFFELSWALSTLLTRRVFQHQLSGDERERLLQTFDKPLEAQSGAVGFAPGILEDSDDTSRFVITLQCLGRPPSPSGLIEKFQGADCFQTYSLEGSPSFSANCNVLLALLGGEQLKAHQKSIRKALAFLLALERSGPLKDKWNLSPQYSRMLFMQALVTVLEKYNLGFLRELPTDLIFHEVPRSICRLLGQTFSDQGSNGSWADSLETTAYAVITLAYCLSLPWSTGIASRLNDCISRGKDYLRAQYGTTANLDYLWVEKVSYRSSLLHSAYCSAASNIAIIKYDWNEVITDCFLIRDRAMEQIQHLIASLPLSQKAQIPFLDLILVEAGLIAAKLMRLRDHLFSRDEIPMTADKYLTFIPMIWVTCNHLNNFNLSADVLWEMVLLSLLNYQVDEFMESVVSRIPEADLPSLKSLLDEQFCVDGFGHSTMENDCAGPVVNGHFKNLNNGVDVFPKAHNKAVITAVETLGRFIKHVVQHKTVVQSPVSVQKEVLSEVRNFLSAHIAHGEDNANLAKSKHSQGTTEWQHANLHRSYIKWVRSTASDDTSCPFSFLFFSCLISERGQNCFESAPARYLSKSLCSHLAAMCRQYNDYGSAKRDGEEGNLNSLDFPEFQRANHRVFGSNGGQNHFPGINGNGSLAHPPIHNGTPTKTPQGLGNGHAQRTYDDGSSTSAKDELMAIAEFERSCMDLAKERLREASSESIMQKIQVFIDVTDMFGQIYVQKDIASRIKKGSS